MVTPFRNFLENYAIPCCYKNHAELNNKLCSLLNYISLPLKLISLIFMLLLLAVPHIKNV